MRADKPQTFRSFKLTADERLWLSQAVGTAKFDARSALARLHGRLAAGFDPDTIDRRLYSNGQVTLLGIWFVDPKTEMFGLIDRAAQWIKERIIASPGIIEISAADVAAGLGADLASVAVALQRLCELGNFYSSASHAPGGGFASLNLHAESAYKAFLSYPGVEVLLERRFNARAVVFPVADTRSLSVGADAAGDASARRHAIRPRTAIILMAMSPDDASLVDTYDAIRDTFREFGVKARRVDDIEHQGRITDRILEEIETCEYVLADLTHARPNVYYEVGYAHAIERHPILVRRSGTGVHFDLSVHNVPEYANVRELKEILTRRLEVLTGRKPRRRS